MPQSKSSKPRMIKQRPEDSSPVTIANTYPLTDELSKFICGKPWGSGTHQLNYFVLAMVEVAKQFRDYGIKQYGHQWFDEQDPEFAAAFGIKKFAERLYKTLVTKRLPMPTTEKLKSNATDAATYALFLVALIEADKVPGAPSKRMGE